MRCFSVNESTTSRLWMCWLISALVCGALVRFTSQLNADATKTGAPLSQGPPPELLHLSSMVGVWDTTTAYRFTPDMPRFDSEGVATVRWSDSRQFLISDQWGLMPDGWKNMLEIITWVPQAGQYRVTELYQTGEVVELTMVVEGNLRKIVRNRSLDGRIIRSDLTVDQVSDSEFTFRCE